MKISEYHREQIDGLTMVKRQLDSLTPGERQALIAALENYLRFRKEVDGFLVANFSDVCTRTCHQSQLSACCSREGIITFFADIVVNLLVSAPCDVDKLLTVLNQLNDGFKCVYLSDKGCLWQLKPIVCQMYLCDRSKKQVFAENSRLKDDWELLEQKRKRFTWPDRPVLFDDLEFYFMQRGCRSPLMYLHNSPGLLRIKQRAGSGHTGTGKI